jgi:hypothetical protein
MHLINHLIKHCLEIIVGKGGLSSVNFEGDKIGSTDFGDPSASDQPVIFVAA